jgi:hypothetical protein
MLGHRISVTLRRADAADAPAFCISHINQFHAASQPANPFQLYSLVKQVLVYRQPGGYYQTFRIAYQHVQLFIGDGGHVAYNVASLRKLRDKRFMDLGCYDYFTHDCIN